MYWYMPPSRGNIESFMAMQISTDGQPVHNRQQSKLQSTTNQGEITPIENDKFFKAAMDKKKS